MPVPIQAKPHLSHVGLSGRWRLRLPGRGAPSAHPETAAGGAGGAETQAFLCGGGGCVDGIKDDVYII